jgi:hypothetical protein
MFVKWWVRLQLEFAHEMVTKSADSKWIRQTEAERIMDFSILF